MRIEAEFAKQLGIQWQHVRRISIGSPPSEQRVCVEIKKDGEPFLLVEVWPQGEYCCFREVSVCGAFVVIGIGERAHFVDVDNLRIRSHLLDGYFGHIYLCGEMEAGAGGRDVLIASASKLYRFAPDGQRHWESAALGMDGVIVQNVQNDLVIGSGEWDPPDGWKKFSLRLSTGERAGGSVR